MSNLAFFFFNDTATTEIYTLSLHDALPIFELAREASPSTQLAILCDEFTTSQFDAARKAAQARNVEDRKSTRLNSSHANISYAVFCLKKKKKNIHSLTLTTTLQQHI